MTSPVTHDNCGVANVTNNHLSTTFALGTTTVTWTVTDNNGNTNNCTQVVTVTDNQAPTITAPAAVTVCSVGSTAVSIGTAIGTDNCGTITFSNNAPALFPIGTTTVTWTANDGHGNTATASQSVTVNPSPTVSVGSIVPSICQGSTSVALGGSYGGGATSAVWSDGLTGAQAGTFTNNSGSTPGTTTYTASASAPSSVTLTLTTSGGLCGTTFASKTITIKPKPVGTSSSAQICNLGSTNLNLATGMPAGTTFTWVASTTSGSVSGSSSCPSSCGTTINQTLNAGTAYGAVNYAITPTSNLGCVGLPYNAAVAVGITGPTVISGPDVLCGITSATYSVSPVAGVTTYTWTVPTGTSGMTIISGQGTTSINVSVSVAFLPGTVSVVASNNCGYSLPATLNVTRKPAVPGAITGPVSTCGVTTAAYSIAPVFGATSYSWTVPTGMTITSGGTTTSITVSIASGFVAGNLGAIATNACGSTSGSLITIIGGVPAIPGTLSGPTNVCGLTSATYSIPAVAYATSYTWSVPSWMTITSGATTTSITVNFTGSPAAGTVSVAAVNGCGTCAARSISTTLAAILPGAITGPTNLCGFTSATYSIATVGSGYTYTWVLAMTGWTIQSGQGTTSIVAIGPGTGTSTSGIVKVSSTNTCGQSSGLRTLGVTYCHSSVTNNNGGDQNGFAFSNLYPNPTSGEFKLDVTSEMDNEIVIEVYDVAGSLVSREKHQIGIGTTTLNTNIENYRAGMYFVRIVDSGSITIYSQTVIKQ